MSFVDKLKSEILPRAVTEGKFGKDIVTFLNYEPDETYSAVDHNCSSVYFGDVILETGKGERIVKSIVIKTFYDVGTGKPLACLRLTNEFLFYTEILPLLRECDVGDTISKIFPKFFFGSLDSSGNDPSKEFLVFENVQKRGFKLCSSRAFLDFDHLELTIRKLAQFHALSFVTKKKHSRRFKDLTLKIKEFYFTLERLKDPSGFFRWNCKRGITPLETNPEYRDKLEDIQKVVDDTELSMGKVASPLTCPLSVICHGDFYRNNIFYRYDPKSGAPTELIFFDLALFRYSSPTIDLSTFLFMNASPELRTSKWEDLLRIYHSTLVSDPNLGPGMVPFLTDLRQDFLRRGFYGYAWSSFNLPKALTEKKEADKEKDWWTISAAERIRISLEMGGEKGTFHLMQNARFMIDEHFDFKYILDLKLYV